MKTIKYLLLMAMAVLATSCINKSTTLNCIGVEGTDSDAVSVVDSTATLTIKRNLTNFFGTPKVNVTLSMKLEKALSDTVVPSPRLVVYDEAGQEIDQLVIGGVSDSIYGREGLQKFLTSKAGTVQAFSFTDIAASKEIVKKLEGAKSFKIEHFDMGGSTGDSETQAKEQAAQAEKSDVGGYTGAAIPNGFYIIATKLDPNKVLDVRYDEVKIWDKNGASTQKWYVTKVGRCYKVAQAVNLSKCLNIAGGIDQVYLDQGIVIVYPFQGHLNELWNIKKYGDYWQITNVGAPSYCIDLFESTTTNGHKVGVFKNHHDDNQQWIFIPVR